jgi:CrcB protein
LNSIIAVFLGAGLGGVLRHLVNQAAVRWSFGSLLGNFPFATFLINVSGSLLMGLVAGYFAFRGAGPSSVSWRLFLATGVLGGYTTFSTFSLEIALMIERGELGQAGIYAFGSLLLGVAGLFLGMWFMKVT